MFKNLIGEYKISKVKRLLKIIEEKELKEKIRAFKKLDQMKINKEMGLIILNASTIDYGLKDGNGGINSSLISLCMKDYHEEYSDIIKKIYPKLDDDCKEKVVYFLSSSDNEYALDLYVDLILKYYKDSDNIPISNLYERKNSYKILFPKLYKALKFKNPKNNILVLINDYLNAGIIPEVDLKKNKKVIQESINKLFQEALKFKFTSTTKALQNKKYLELRFYLEIAINIEYYVSGRKSEDLLKKLFNAKDNQLKLFILENYIKKGKDISKYKLDLIAKDNLSRYPLYDLLTIYNKKELMPKTYLVGEKIAQSDLLINFSLINGFKETPKNVKFLKTKIINGYKYYIFRFKYTFEYNPTYDAQTNYLLENTGIDKYIGKKVTKDFIGISGGYDKDQDLSTVQTNNQTLLWHVINKEKVDDIIELIVPDLEKKKEERNDKNLQEILGIDKDIKKKIKHEKKKQKKLKRIQKKIEKKRKKEEKKYLKNLEKQEKLLKKETQKEIKKEIINNEEFIDTTFEEETKKGFKFSYILRFLFVVFLGTLIVFIYYLNNPEFMSLPQTTNLKINNLKTSKISDTNKFIEIDGHDIFNQPENNYYVLFFKKKNDQSVYFPYINSLLLNNVKIYYVNLNDDKNNFLYSENDLGFVLTTDRYLNVVDADFNFYVDGKVNIIEELQDEIKQFEKTNVDKK